MPSSPSSPPSITHHEWSSPHQEPVTTEEDIHGLTKSEWIEFGEKVLNLLQTSSFPLIEHICNGKAIEIDSNNIGIRIAHPEIWNKTIERMGLFSTPYVTCNQQGQSITLHPISGQIPENLKGHPFFVWLWRMRDRELSGDMNEILHSITQNTQSITESVRSRTSHVTNT